MTALDELIKAFVSYHQAVGSAPATVRHYEQSLALLTRCLGESDLPLEAGSLTTPVLHTFAGWLRTTPTKPWRGKTERSIWGIHGALKDIKIWVKWLYENDHLEMLPKVPVPKLPRTLFPVLSDAELERVFACSQLADNSEIAIRNRALLAFMLDTGVRLSEVAGLQKADLDLAEGAARIRGKGQKERLVYFSDSCREAMVRWVAVRGDDAGTFFWLAASGIKMLFKRIKQETDLPLFTPHQVRHTALTMLVREGVDLHTIKRLAGHASVTTTESYLALAAPDVQAKHRSASPFDTIHQRTQPAHPARRRLKSRRSA